MYRTTRDLESIEIDLLLEGIYQAYGFDFRNYKRSTIERRIFHRMRMQGLVTVSELLNIVLHDEHVMERLFSDLTIGVTEMFREPEFFSAIRHKVLPLLAHKKFFRIWHAGCCTGEEVYSMAITLKETGLYNYARIYATDINDQYIDHARRGVYHLTSMQKSTQNYQRAGGKRDFSTYYQATSHDVVITPELRRNIIFAQHNLVTDHSFNEFDLIVCRNVLIYFNSLLQERVFNLFHDSLAPGGCLALGSKEHLPLGNLDGNYEEIDGAVKIYQRLR